MDGVATEWLDEEVRDWLVEWVSVGAIIFLGELVVGRVSGGLGSDVVFCGGLVDWLLE